MSTTNYAPFCANLQPLNQETAKLKVLESKVAAKVMGEQTRRALGDIHSNNIRQGIITDSAKFG